MLTKKEKQILTEMGVRESDFRQIEEVKEVIILTNDDDKELTEIGAKRLIGLEAYASGLNRAAFHWDSEREYRDGSGRCVHFDASHYFKED